MVRKIKPTRRPWAVVAALAFVLAPAMVLAPDVSYAGDPAFRLVMYEVTEALVLKPAKGKDTDAGLAFARRMATASLLGTDVKVLGSGVPSLGTFAVADATSNVDLNTASKNFGTGPVSGTIQTLTDIDPNRNSLDTLLVTQTIDIKATLDLTPALALHPMPLANISGTWKSKSLGLQGTFTGVFQIAFQYPGLPGSWYLNLGGGSCRADSVAVGPMCSVTQDENLLGIPLTKAVITFSID